MRRRLLQQGSYLFIACSLAAVIAGNGYGHWRKLAKHRLLVAAADGDVSTIRSLLWWGISPNGIEDFAYRSALSRAPIMDAANGKTAMMLAATNGHTDALKLLLDHGANANARDDRGNTALYLAMQERQHNAALLLLMHGADPNLVPTSFRANNDSVLSIAADRDWKDILTVALDRGARPDGVSHQHRATTDCPLYAAVQAGHLDAARLLLERGAKVEGRSVFGATALMEAAQAGSIPLMTLLLQRGARIGDRDNGGMTPLMWAAQSGNIAAVRLLLDKGSEINARHASGWTPLAFAAEAGNPALVHFLLARGADIRGRMGSSALSAAEEVNTDTARRAIVLDLLAHGAGAQGVPLQAAASAPDVLLLLAHGGKPNAADAQGVTPLIAAAWSHRVDIVRMLLQHGADIHARDHKGRTALMAVMEDTAGAPGLPLNATGNRPLLPVVAALLAGGADVNARDAMGKTVLQYALYNGNPALVQALVLHGVDVNARGDRPATPLQIAEKGKQSKIAAILKQAGAKD